MSYSDVLATISILISAGTAALSFYAIFRKRAKIKIKFPYPETNIIFVSDGTDNYQTPNRISLLIEVANLSSEPITISRFILKPDDIKDDLYKFENFLKAAQNYNVAYYDDNHAYSLPIGKEQLLLPLRLDPYSTVIGYIFVPTAADIRAFCGTLTAETIEKSFNFRVKINTPDPPDPICLQSLPRNRETK